MPCVRPFGACRARIPFFALFRTCSHFFALFRTFSHFFARFARFRWPRLLLCILCRLCILLLTMKYLTGIAKENIERNKTQQMRRSDAQCRAWIRRPDSRRPFRAYTPTRYTHPVRARKGSQRARFRALTGPRAPSQGLMGSVVELESPDAPGLSGVYTPGW